MIDKIIWSPESEKDLLIIIDYLLLKWNVSVTNDFIDKIENTINKISSKPKLYPIIHKKENIRRCVITKHNSIFYFFDGQTIYILRVFDTRQNPTKLKFD